MARLNKIKKFNESDKFKIAKFSELGGKWTPSADVVLGDNLQKLTKEVIKRVSNILNVVEKYGIVVIGIQEDDYATRNDIIYPSESGLKEFRVILGAVGSLEEIEDEWGVTTVEEYIDMYGEDHLEDFHIF